MAVLMEGGVRYRAWTRHVKTIAPSQLEQVPIPVPPDEVLNRNIATTEPSAGYAGSAR